MGQCDIPVGVAPLYQVIADGRYSRREIDRTTREAWLPYRTRWYRLRPTRSTV